MPPICSELKEMVRQRIIGERGSQKKSLSIPEEITFKPALSLFSFPCCLCKWRKLLINATKTSPGSNFEGTEPEVKLKGLQVQAFGFLRTSISLASGESASGMTLYFQAIRGGADTITDSILPLIPNFTPLS